MSYSIDFHFGDVPSPPNQALEAANRTLQQIGMDFVQYCHRLAVDKDDVDLAGPRVEVDSFEKAQLISKNWAGRAHQYRWRMSGRDIDWLIYSWHGSRNGLALSIDRRNWRHIVETPSLLAKCCGVVCELSAATQSPFGVMQVNSEFVSLTTEALQQVLRELNRDALTVPLFWVSESKASHQSLMIQARANHSVIHFTSGYVAVLENRLITESAL